MLGCLKKGNGLQLQYCLQICIKEYKELTQISYRVVWLQEPRRCTEGHHDISRNESYAAKNEKYVPYSPQKV